MTSEITRDAQDVVNSLETLAQWEIDGSFLVSQAIDNVSSQEIRDRLIALKQECENNISKLFSLILEQGGKPPEHTKDFKGFFMQGYAAMRGMISDSGVMSALHTNVQMLLKAFETALDSALPDKVKVKLQEVYEIDKQHLEYFASKK